jgi:Lrp/AsnC family leucine-responsive transcriptional regulator
MEIKLDDTDRKLLMLLQEDAKQTTKQLAYHLGLTVTPVFERIKRLEKQGVIDRYVAILNKEKIGRKLIAFCNVSIKEHSREYINHFEKQITKFPEVMECYHLAGMYDYILKVTIENMDAYHDFIYNKLASIDNIGNVRSSFVMNELKNSTVHQLI